MMGNAKCRKSIRDADVILEVRPKSRKCEGLFSQRFAYAALSSLPLWPFGPGYSNIVQPDAGNGGVADRRQARQH
jgi:hypothetical protein